MTEKKNLQPDVGAIVGEALASVSMEAKPVVAPLYLTELKGGNVFLPTTDDPAVEHKTGSLAEKHAPKNRGDKTVKAERGGR